MNPANSHKPSSQPTIYGPAGEILLTRAWGKPSSALLLLLVGFKREGYLKASERVEYMLGRDREASRTKPEPSSCRQGGEKTTPLSGG
jgi:hypothetical protein